MKHFLLAAHLMVAVAIVAGLLYCWTVVRQRVKKADAEMSSLEGLRESLEVEKKELAKKASLIVASETVAETQVEAQPQDVMWKVVFHDDFNGDSIGPGWRVLNGQWEQKDGKLRSLSVEDYNMLVLRHDAFAGDVQIRYDCRTVECYNGAACDMSVATALSGGGQGGITTGYLFRFGSYDNSFSGLSIGHRTMVHNREVRIVPGKKHSVVVQRLGGRLSMTVDGRPVFLVKDKHPFGGNDRTAAGLYFHRSVVEVDQFTVSQPVFLRKEVPDRYRRGLNDVPRPAGKRPPAHRKEANRDVF